MKLLLLLLGYYSKHTPFYLYQIPDTTILLFKLSDISALFNVSDLARHPSLSQVPHGECYSINTSIGPDDDDSKSQQEYFLSAQVLSRTAVALNRYRLAELCKLKPNDYAAGLANSILKNVATFERAQDEGFRLMDLPLSPVVSPTPSPKQPGSMDSTVTTMTTATPSAPAEAPEITTTATSTISNTHQQGATLSPRVHPVKSEPLSPPPLRLSQPKESKDDQRSPNPMALGKVLWSKGTERRSPSTRPSADDDLSSNNKRQRIERKVLPKPTHTVSSQQTHPSMMNALTSGQGQTLLAKRQGKNSRHLTIFAPSYADPLSQMQHHQHQHQQHTNSTQSSSLHHGYSSQVSSRQPPKTANMLHPGHTLAPLLSPRAAPVISSQQQHQQHQPGHRISHHHHPEPKTTGGAIGKQEFAIPPIVPSQQQPPHTAHPHHSSGNGNHGGYTSSSSLLGRPTSSSYHGYSKPSRLEPTAPHPTNGGNNSNNNTSNTTSASTSTLPLTAAAAPMPPQTPTTYSFAALQRQQFLQPFEHLFDTIETTRTLKSTLDDQIRRSSTLLQTLQASSTTVEGLIRSYVKEMQRDMTSRMDEVLESMIKRIGQLESKLDMTGEPLPTASNSSTSLDHHSSQVNGNNNNNSNSTAPSPTASSSLKSPTTIVKSQNDIGSSEYQSMLATLRERLDRLESQLEK
ncbi:hypothetical protein BCR42DRAFT_405698 [Absidia repens]|uniref:Uncharacterized protein n=1 Tax=Absidia repens TaxID=90262 RepID=A0A1X2ITR8_9FUNG|nr:hypothetical protein BCR42DRAFT_405698 [Absidia repens]